MTIRFIIDGPIKGTIRGLTISQGGAAPSSWTYASLAAAESSGDPWADTNEIIITGGATFIYYSALDTNGHSGLIHKNPFNDASETSAGTFLYAEGPNTDPDTWSNITDASTGSKGVDYDFDVSTNSRVRDLTAAGRAVINVSRTADADVQATILRDLKGANTITTDWAYIQMYAKIGAADARWVYLSGQYSQSATNWSTYDGSYTASSVAWNTAAHIFVYIDDTRYAFWKNGDSAPFKTGTPVTNTTDDRDYQIVAGKAGIGGAADVILSTVLGAKITL